MSLGVSLACTTSGSIADDANAQTGAGLLWGAVLAGGSDAATLILYDNTAKSGTVLVKLVALTGDTQSITFPQPVAFQTGCEVSLAGTGAVAVVYTTPR